MTSQLGTQILNAIAARTSELTVKALDREIAEKERELLELVAIRQVIEMSQRFKQPEPYIRNGDSDQCAPLPIRPA